jgi:hypothetical protein
VATEVGPPAVVVVVVVLVVVVVSADTEVEEPAVGGPLVVVAPVRPGEVVVDSGLVTLLGVLRPSSASPDPPADVGGNFPLGWDA